MLREEKPRHYKHLTLIKAFHLSKRQYTVIFFKNDYAAIHYNDKKSDRNKVLRCHKKKNISNKCLFKLITEKSPATLFVEEMFLEHQINILEWFLMDHVTLKTGVTAAENFVFFDFLLKNHSISKSKKCSTLCRSITELTRREDPFHVVLFGHAQHG